MEISNCVNKNVAIEKINAVQPKLNAVVTMIDEDANTNAGKLAGVPVALKDNISTCGIKTTASSRILDNYVPVYDATIVKKLREAGADFVCKASMDELGMGGTNKNAYTGAVHNPYDLDRIPGGSSGGCAALVAAGCVPLAIGTDTGDSVRKPAAYCGVVGVKPTYGRISRYGIIPYASSLDHVGYFTTNVKDAALALEVLAGRDDHDMTSSYKEVGEYSKLLNGDLTNKTIGVFKTVLDEVENEELKAQFNALVSKLEEKGAKIVNVEMPKEYMELIAPVYKTIANAEATANHSNLDGIRFGMREEGQDLEEVMTNTRTKGFSSYVRARFVIGSYSLFEENQDRLFRKAQKIRRLIVEAYAKMFEECDAVLSVAAPTIAPLIHESSNVRFGVSSFAEEHMQLQNFSGYPSIILPLGKVDSMPVAVNLTCKPFEEQEMFDVSSAIEECTGLKGQCVEG